MEENKPSYYAVIPAEVRYQPDLSASAKLLYAEISALCNKEGYCWASNSYFSNLFNVSNRQVTRWIAQLAKYEFISLDIKKASKGIEVVRLLYLTTKMSIPLEENVHRGIDKNVYDNTTSINIKNNKESISHSKTVVLPDEKDSINPLIDLFKAINPQYTDLFRNTTQRNAIKNLVIKHGYAKIEEIVRALPDIIYQKYAPRITTPLQLESKLADLVAFVKQNKAKKNNFVQI